MKAYALLIKKNAPLEQIEEHMKTVFRSEDYMVGFLDGYLFDNYNVYELKVYEQLVKTQSQALKDRHLKFVYVGED